MRQALVFLSLIFPSLLHAKDVSPAAPAPVFGGVLQVGLALLLVIAAIAATAWLLRRFGPAHLAGGSAMRIVGGVMLSQRERLVLVEIGETWLVVGVAPGQVSAVHSMPRPAQSELPPQSLPQTGFAERLQETWRKRGKP